MWDWQFWKILQLIKIWQSNKRQQTSIRNAIGLPIIGLPVQCCFWHAPLMSSLDGRVSGETSGVTLNNERHWHQSEMPQRSNILKDGVCKTTVVSYTGLSGCLWLQAALWRTWLWVSMSKPFDRGPSMLRGQEYPAGLHTEKRLLTYCTQEGRWDCVFRLLQRQMTRSVLGVSKRCRKKTHWTWMNEWETVWARVIENVRINQRQGNL